MTDPALAVVGCIAVLAVVLSAAWFTNEVRAGHLSPRATRVGAVACGAGLVVMIVSDFPLAANRFWADHSVLAAMLSSALLVGAVYLAYESRELERQSELASGLSGTAVGGLIDYLVDVEVALSLATNSVPPDRIEPEHWRTWDTAGKPLRWLRQGRALLGTERDARLREANVPDVPPAWAGPLIDQVIRRLSAGIREWGPLVQASTDGTTVLILISDIRVALMEIVAQMESGSPWTAELHASVVDLRKRLRILTVCFEQWSGVNGLRPEILTTHRPLGTAAPIFARFSRTLDARFERAAHTLGMETP